MDLTDYTTFDEVRSALGVDSGDLPDETLQLRRFLTEVEIGLEEVGSTVLTKYADIFLKDVGSRTAAEKLVYDRTRLCATYIAAAACLSGLPLFAMKTETDAKSGYTRFSGDTTKNVADEVRSSLSRYTVALQTAIAALDGAASRTPSSRVYARAFTPTYDPVTGS